MGLLRRNVSELPGDQIDNHQRRREIQLGVREAR